MTAVNRRGDFEWPMTTLADIKLIPRRASYSFDEPITVNLGFRVVGGLREAFIPDVWTSAWEDNDKMVRYTMKTSIISGSVGIFKKEVASTGAEVRKAKFYWSRDPDLPYRIWTAIVNEDGSGPQIPASVDDAKAKMFDVVKQYVVPAASLGRGERKIAGKVHISWGRRSFIEKGRASGQSKELTLRIE
jgi:hypothetical protein